MSGSREIELTRGYLAVVDADDFGWLSQWEWCANFVPGAVLSSAAPCTRSSVSGAA